MTASLQQVRQHLARKDFKYREVADRNLIICPMESKYIDDLQIYIQIADRGNILQFQIPQILTVKNCVYKGLVFQTMLGLNYELNLVRFEYDPSDGEVRASIELPLEDSPLTDRQFDRCLRDLVGFVDLVAAPRLQQVMSTGIDPALKERGKALLAELNPEMVEILRELLTLDRDEWRN
jgi:hypothetical protein